MDSTQDPPYTRRLLERAASVRRNQKNSLRCRSEDSRRKNNILQAIINDETVKIKENAADCRTARRASIAANMFVNDYEQLALRRCSFGSNDGIISHRNDLPRSYLEEKCSSSHLTGQSKFNYDCKTPKNLQRSFDKALESVGPEIVERKDFNRENLRISKNDYYPKLRKTANKSWSESKNGLEMTRTFDLTSLNSSGNTTKDSLSSSSYMKGFELGNVKWRGPLYAAASNKSDRKIDLDFLNEISDFGDRPESSSRSYDPGEPELVKAVHKEIPGSPRMRVEVRTIGDSNRKVIPGGIESPGSPRPWNLPIAKFLDVPQSVDPPCCTPLTAEIERLNTDIQRLGLQIQSSVVSPKSSQLEPQSPQNRIYPDLSKSKFPPTGYSPKTLFQSPTSPNQEFSDSSKTMNGPGSSSVWSGDKVGHNRCINSTDFSREASSIPESSKSVKNESGKTVESEGFQPKLESTRKSVDEISENAVSPFVTPAAISPESSESAATSSPPDGKLNATMNSTVPYDIDNFLEDALGDELYNTTMTFPPSETQEKSMSQFNASELISEDRTPLQKKNKKFFKKTPKTEPPPPYTSTFNRTMTIYRSFTQRLKNKLRPGLKSVTEPTVPNDATTIKDHSACEDEEIKTLLQQANIQHTLMYQAIKALKVCNSMKEFTASTEQVESERSLLVAGLRRAAALEEIKRLSYESNNNKNQQIKPCEFGEVSIRNFSLPLKTDVAMDEVQNGDFVQWFVIAVSAGSSVWASRAVSCPIKSPRIIFDGEFTARNLSPNFKITVKIFSLRMRRTTFNHDDKYHLNQAEKNATCPSPKKIILGKSGKPLSPKQVEQDEFSPITNTAFLLSGMVELYLHDFSLNSPWPLTSVSPNSLLQGTMDLTLSCKLHLSVSHAGFLTHGDGAEGPAAWNRRWCVLENQTLRFWNYPCDQEDKEPLSTIDLTNCISGEITLVDRSLCAKPRTLSIETAKRSIILDRSSMLQDCRMSCTVVRHLLSFDSPMDLSQWKLKLNHVIMALRDWNVTDRTPVDVLDVSDL